MCNAVSKTTQRENTITINVLNLSESPLDLLVCKLGNQIRYIADNQGKDFTITFDVPTSPSSFLISGFNRDPNHPNQGTQKVHCEYKSDEYVGKHQIHFLYKKA